MQCLCVQTGGIFRDFIGTMLPSSIKDCSSHSWYSFFLAILLCPGLPTNVHEVLENTSVHIHGPHMLRIKQSSTYNCYGNNIDSNQITVSWQTPAGFQVTYINRRTIRLLNVNTTVFSDSKVTCTAQSSEGNLPLAQISIFIQTFRKFGSGYLATLSYNYLSLSPHVSIHLPLGWLSFHCLCICLGLCLPACLCAFMRRLDHISK